VDALGVCSQCPDKVYHGVSTADNETGWRMALTKLATLIETFTMLRRHLDKVGQTAGELRLTIPMAYIKAATG
jgi:hypothetical protein